ncbi:MAG: hypothetical protein A2Z86_04830 [Candidatus Glassbacteria bacterium GWA2_58_10]|uniref:Uncharacterized protein n=1 Tax=Candidatus Glassbacteria bacterium GWA2_58_10 TaxID=1817865 RepID=A0A1F5YCY6_9BACT|nr:MAG: hypothetical protein A2Z86_04830 [Candidatus Glassbacteria bacterium GWA2_58_10]
MSDLLQVFLSGVEDMAKSMKIHAADIEKKTGSESELVEKVEALTARVEKLIGLLEEKLGTAIKVQPAKGKRMMDIKQRINEIIAQHPEGIRPPQLARIIGTKVQNLYPHLKAAVQNGTLLKDSSGSYLIGPAKEKTRPVKARKSK